MGLLGSANVVAELPPATGSEDVHLLLGPHADVPFTFLMVGVADPKVFAAARKQGRAMPYAPHSEDFVVDLKAIPVGTKVATVAMMELLGKGAYAPTARSAASSSVGRKPKVFSVSDESTTKGRTN
jgi:hippurate hydrolase